MLIKGMRNMEAVLFNRALKPALAADRSQTSKSGGYVFTG